MNGRWWWVLVISWSLSPVGLRADTDRSFKVPVLSVAADGQTGNCQQVEFSLSRKTVGMTPLSIAISEDTPGGAGESIRASVWMAAMVAAMDRLDDLGCVKINISLPGQVDGPSAGGVMCLAILSALDGQDLPADMAMTGSIMPDGTIGAVDGISLKMQAAAKAGAKRILLPAYIRFETDAKTGQEVDLKRLAETLKLQFLPVASVAEAYQVAHRLPRLPVLRPDPRVLELPTAAEELLKARYGAAMAEGIKLWDAIPKDQQAEIARQPVDRDLLVTAAWKADDAHRSGSLMLATDSAEGWQLQLSARKQASAAFEKLKGDDVDANLKAMDTQIEQVLQSVPNVPALVAANRQMAEASAQLCAGYYDLYGVVGLVQMLQAAATQVQAELAKPELTDEQKRELITSLVGIKAVSLQVSHAVAEGVKLMQVQTPKLAETLPRLAATGDPAAVERLFYSAYMAADNKFQKDVVKGAAGALQVAEGQVLARLRENDLGVAMYEPVPLAMQRLHADLVQPGKASRFNQIVAAHAYASSLATVSSLITRWSELDMDLNQETVRYHRTGLLNYLLTTARETALANIAECHRKSIPCIAAITCFESAELSRDEPGEDKVEVLSAYWNASLQAKVLLMLFSGAK